LNSIQRLSNSHLESLQRKTVYRLEDQVVSVVLYGSVARGTSTTESDIDILVIIEEENSSVRNQIKGMEKDFRNQKN